MLIVRSQIHIWQNGKMSAHHRQIPTYSADDARQMARPGSMSVIHPPQLPRRGGHVSPSRRCACTKQILHLGHFDLESPGSREHRPPAGATGPGMVGFRFTFQSAASEGVVDRRSLDWFWAASEKAELPAAPAGGNMAALAKNRRATSRSEAHIDHLGAPTAGAPG